MGGAWDKLLLWSLLTAFGGAFVAFAFIWVPDAYRFIPIIGGCILALGILTFLATIVAGFFIRDGEHD